jgi:hypothetical protein
MVEIWFVSLNFKVQMYNKFVCFCLKKNVGSVYHVYGV